MAEMRRDPSLALTCVAVVASLLPLVVLSTALTTVAGCKTAARDIHGTTASGTATERSVKYFEHDLRHVQHHCADAGMCVGYTFSWTGAHEVTIELRAVGFRGRLFVQRNFTTDVPETIDAAGVIRVTFVSRDREPVRVLVAGRSRNDRGPTSLMVSPSPHVLQLPEPPPSEADLAAATRTRTSAKREEFSAGYAKQTAGFRSVLTETGEIGHFSDVTFKLALGRCYKIVFTVDDVEASRPWRPTVHSIWQGMSHRVGLVPFTHSSQLGAASEPICPTSEGNAAVEWSQTDAQNRDGEGTYRVEVWERDISPSELADVRSREAAVRDDASARQCNRCRSNTEACLTARNSSGCMDSFRRCLADSRVSNANCPY
jgi:hypothetical protein